MKNAHLFASLFLSSLLISAMADPVFDPNAPVKPAPIPTKPDREKTSYALGMNLGLQRKQAKSDADIEAFAKGLKETFENKPTEIPSTDSMQAINVMRTRGTNATAAEKRMFAYAMGMRWGNQLKDFAPDCDTDVVIQAIKDVAAGKPTKITETEMKPLLEQGHDWSLYIKGEKNREEGAAFLARNAKEPGVKTLPNGLQYKIIKEGTGPAASTMGEHQVLFIKYKGSFIDGREFDHHNRFPKNLEGGWPAWLEALKRMKVGDAWRVYSPPQFSFGREGDPARNVGPDATVVWDLEIREIVNDNDPRLGTGRLGHGIAGRDDP
ncbi:MAG: FKBP-type peptidyl-prolyl cis-trans isomerase N-terminal domain-containing protein [Limisphaerales bacterium]